MARAYVDQLARGNAVPASLADDLSATLDRSAIRLRGGARDEDLAARLESFAVTVNDERGDATTKKRRAALSETLEGIAGRLR